MTQVLERPQLLQQSPSPYPVLPRSQRLKTAKLDLHISQCLTVLAALELLLALELTRPILALGQPLLARQLSYSIQIAQIAHPPLVSSAQLL